VVVIETCLVAEVRMDGDDCPLAAASAATGVPIDARPPQRRGDGNVLLRFSAPASDELRRFLDERDDVRYLHAARVDGTDSYRCLSKHACVVHELVDVGFLIDAMQYRDGSATVRGAVVGYDVLEGVMDAAGRTVGVTLTGVQELESEAAEPVGPDYGLTDAQAESLRAAVAHGYFEVPRETTAEEVASGMGISKSAFLERLRRGQRAVFGTLYG
jgi:predicted DNA binding protein